MVEPAQPPTNIRAKNKVNGKLPQPSNSALTYPVPVNIEIVLKKTDLKLKLLLLFIITIVIYSFSSPNRPFLRAIMTRIEGINLQFNKESMRNHLVLKALIATLLSASLCGALQPNFKLHTHSANNT